MFQAFNSRWRLALLTLGGLGFVVLGLWFIGIFGPDHPQGLKATAVGWFSILFFGGCALLTLLRMRERKPAIQIDTQGLLWRQWSADRPIAWDAMERVGVVMIRRQKMLGLGISAQELAQASAWRRRLDRANQAMVGFPVCVTAVGTDCSFGDLLAAVDRYAPARLLDAFRFPPNR